MSNTFPISPDHNDPWDNPTTGESFKFDRHRGWINTKGVRYDGDTMTGTLVVPDTRINGGLLSADEADEADGVVEGPPDVTTWEIQNFPVADQELILSNVVFSEELSMWLAGGSRHGNYDLPHLLYSYDGKEWDYVPNSPYIDIRGISWGNGRFVFIGTVPGGGAPMEGYYSEDGFKWLKSDPLPSDNLWSPICFGVGNKGPRFVCLSAKDYRGGNKSERAMYSEDGKTWTGVDTSHLGNGSGNPSYNWTSIAFSSDVIIGEHGYPIWVAVSDNGNSKDSILKSEDGENWIEINSGETGRWSDIAYGGNGNFVAVDGSTVYSTSSMKKILMSSNNANTWSLRSSGDNMMAWESVSYGDGVWVAVGHESILYNTSIPTPSQKSITTSTDGRTWRAQQSPNEGAIMAAVAYGAGQFVAVAGWDDGTTVDAPMNNGRIMTAGELRSSSKKRLYWNDDNVVVQSASRTTATNLLQLSSMISSKTGRAKYLQDSAPPETQTIEISEESSKTFDLTYNNGELWYQPSTNTLHIRDSDEWVALFQ